MMPGSAGSAASILCGHPVCVGGDLEMEERGESVKPAVMTGRIVCFCILYLDLFNCESRVAWLFGWVDHLSRENNVVKEVTLTFPWLQK